MNFFDILKSANSNLLRNKGRSFLTILAIFVGTFTIIMTTGINTGVNNYIDKQVANAGGDGYMEIVPEAMVERVASMMGGGDVIEYNPDKNSTQSVAITNEKIEEIKKIEGIEMVRPFINVSAEYVTSEATDKKYTIRLSEMPTDRINVDMSSGRMVDVNGDEAEIALAPKYAQALGFENDDNAVGKTIELAVINRATGTLSTVEAKVVGVQNQSVTSIGGSWINHALFEKTYEAIMDGMPDAVKNISNYAVAEFNINYSNKQIQKIKDNLKEIGLTGMTVDDQVGMMKTFFDAITIVLTIFGVIALVAASIGIINTLYMAVQERTREIGLMKAMGMGAGKIYLMFSLEAIMLGLWGSVLGILVANAARLIVNDLANATFLKDLPGFTLVEFDPVILLIITAIVMFIAFLAGSLPARKAARKDPIEALRYE